MFTFFKNVFTKSEDILKENEYKLFFCTTKSVFTKIVLKPSTTCLDIFKQYNNEILTNIDNIKVKFKDNTIDSINMNEFFFTLIQEESSHFTNINLKLSQRPLKYINGISGIGLYFLHKIQLCVNYEIQNRTNSIEHVEDKHKRPVSHNSIIAIKKQDIDTNNSPNKPIKPSLIVEDKETDIIFQGQLLKYSFKQNKFSTKVYIKLYTDKLILTNLKSKGRITI